jgi:acyl carrier protein
MTLIRTEVLSQIERVADEQQKRLPPLTDDVTLLDTGLDSLCMAIIVARLEDVLKVDPFSVAEESAFPVTVGDLVKLYENAVPS